MQAQGIEMTYKVNEQWVPLHPYTDKSQVLDWNMGEAYGPYILTLKASDWQDLQQIISLPDMIDTDQPICNKVLSGTLEEQIAQSDSYNLIDGRFGVQSLNGEVKFLCTKKSPTIDIQVQLFWVR